MTQRLIVLALLPSAERAESVISQLGEVGVLERTISLILKNEQDARAVIDDWGPLEGTNVANLDSRLSQIDVPSDRIDLYSRGVNAGEALLAVNAGTQWQDAVKETLESADGHDFYATSKSH